jgi:hypothetical protein
MEHSDKHRRHFPQPRHMAMRQRALLLVLAMLVGVLQAPTRAAPPVREHIEALAALGPRVAGTPAEGRAAGYIAGELAALGLDVRVQPFSIRQGLASSNIEATLPGRDPAYGVIYAGAHYDSVQGSPGANDNASGTAVVLELARLLAADPISPTVRFLAFGAEEIGLRGSAAYVQTLDGRERLRAYGMLNFDCVGVGSEQIAGSLGDDQTLSDLVIAAATRRGYQIGNDESPGSSDHISFGAVGIPVAFLYTAGAPTLCGPDYHRSTDTPDKVDDRQVERVIAIAHATILDLAAVTRPVEPVQLFMPVVVISSMNQQ